MPRFLPLCQLRDGQWLVFVSDRDHQQGSDIYQIRIDDTHAPPERLTISPHSRKSSLRWSPDGRLIAFIADESGARHILYTLDIATAQLREVTEVYPPFQDWQLNWSSDGAWLYILKERNGEPIWHRIQPDGENLEPLPDLEGLHSLAWSPIREQSRIRLRIALIVYVMARGTLLFLNTHPVYRRLTQKRKVMSDLNMARFVTHRADFFR